MLVKILEGSSGYVLDPLKGCVTITLSRDEVCLALDEDKEETISVLINNEICEFHEYEVVTYEL